MRDQTSSAPKCSFCAKPHHDVLKLIIGPGDLAICNECVGLCMELVARDHNKWFMEVLEEIYAEPANDLP